MRTLLHTLPSDFTDNLILTPEKFLYAFQATFSFLISTVMLKLIQMILPLFQSLLFWLHHGFFLVFFLGGLHDFIMLHFSVATASVNTSAVSTLGSFTAG